MIRRVTLENISESDVFGESIVLESSVNCTYEQLIEIVVGKPVDCDINHTS